MTARIADVSITISRSVDNCTTDVKVSSYPSPLSELKTAAGRMLRSDTVTHPFEFTPIGTVHNEIDEPLDDIWGSVKSRIDLDASRFPSDCLQGLAEFSHVEIVFLFHRVDESEIVTGSRHPRNRRDWPQVGIFAQRGKNRPNRIGVTICRLLSVEDLSLDVAGLDAVDGTPVLDIKPYMREFAARGDVRQPQWASELMSGYWTGSAERT
jgi:tRNA-Thr(GGU) m(6)t(6)A37 methyltransferase TsaA